MIEVALDSLWSCKERAGFGAYYSFEPIGNHKAKQEYNCTPLEYFSKFKSCISSIMEMVSHLESLVQLDSLRTLWGKKIPAPLSVKCFLVCLEPRKWSLWDRSTGDRSWCPDNTHFSSLSHLENLSSHFLSLFVIHTQSQELVWGTLFYF